MRGASGPQTTPTTNININKRFFLNNFAIALIVSQ
jgi:hypothetical protein